MLDLESVFDTRFESCLPKPDPKPDPGFLSGLGLGLGSVNLTTNRAPVSDPVGRVLRRWKTGQQTGPRF